MCLTCSSNSCLKFVFSSLRTNFSQVKKRFDASPLVIVSTLEYSTAARVFVFKVQIIHTNSNEITPPPPPIDLNAFLPNDIEIDT